MPRLFVALPVPGLVAAELALSRGGLPGARWVEPADQHVTLAFLGDIDEGLARDCDEALDGVRQAAFDVILRDHGAFGGRKPHAVFARVEPSPPLLALQGAVAGALRRAGAEVEARAYVPHVTLARLRGGPGAVADWLARRPPGTLGWRATSFALMSARDQVGGGPYRVEVEYPLEGD